MPHIPTLKSNDLRELLIVAAVDSAAMGDASTLRHTSAPSLCQQAQGHTACCRNSGSGPGVGLSLTQPITPDPTFAALHTPSDNDKGTAA